MDDYIEWGYLRTYLATAGEIPALSNPFYKRLITVINDAASGVADVMAVYRDVLKSSPQGQFELPVDLKGGQLNHLNFEGVNFQEFGLVYNSFLKTLSIDIQKSKLGLEQVDRVYSLEQKRIIPDTPLDIALANKLSPNKPENEVIGNYRGRGQQAAIRTALQSKPGSTLLVNLPTGTGKTLVAYALCLFSSPEKLTLVITPTIALAIEQADRAKAMLIEAGESVHSNYFFGGDQTPQQRQDIKDRIRSGQQRILFTSPESARGALLPSLFDAVKEQKLASIVIDEAHIVDQWGDEFRPDFQIFAAVTHALIKESQCSIKCLLLSATFTDENISTLKTLFSFDHHDFIEVHSSFLRPEIQYQVRQVSTPNEFDQELEQALIELPRPLIIYALEREKVKAAMSLIKSLGYQRVECFTGDTGTDQRATLINRWNSNDIDIMVATSAFGVGMDKDDVKSILHIQMPENLDRFYQEVGRSGRDGRASQSLVIFNRSDLSTAESINKSTLIGNEKGLKRWRSLFDHRLKTHTVSVINITNMHQEIDRESKSNESWNWRTLLLMQRSGMIEIEFGRPINPVQWHPDQSVDEFNTQEKSFYEEYYQHIKITPLVNDHTDKACWDRLITPQRIDEHQRREIGYQRLKTWLLNPEKVSLCATLLEQYTVAGITPQSACGGCPCCRNQGKLYGNSPTLDYDPIIIKKDPRQVAPPQFIYYPIDAKTTLRKLISRWGEWIRSLIERGRISTIYSSPEMAKRLSLNLPIGMQKFWANSLLPQEGSLVLSGPSLIIVPPGNNKLPNIEDNDHFFILLAPENIEAAHYKRLWWQEYESAVSLNHFLSFTG
ncbi:protein DpdF [Pseudomonadales bacterium]|nr:protein DpdF [Pseudomonadales bacterium]